MDSVGLMRLASMSLYAPFVAAGLPGLFDYISAANGSPVHAVVDFMTPYALGQAPWPHENIDNATFSVYFEEYRRAAWAPGWTGPCGELGGALAAARSVKRVLETLLTLFATSQGRTTRVSLRRCRGTTRAPSRSSSGLRLLRPRDEIHSSS